MRLLSYYVSGIIMRSGDKMKKIQVGDIVARKSYGQDVFFRVTEIKSSNKGNVMVLRGVSERIQADAPECDLILPGEKSVMERKARIGDIIESKTKEIALSGNRKI